MMMSGEGRKSALSLNMSRTARVTVSTSTLSPISSWKARILLTVPSICRTLEVMFSAMYWSTGSGRFMPRRMALFLMMATRVS